MRCTKVVGNLGDEMRGLVRLDIPYACHGYDWDHRHRRRFEIRHGDHLPLRLRNHSDVGCVVFPQLMHGNGKDAFEPLGLERRRFHQRRPIIEADLANTVIAFQELVHRSVVDLRIIDFT